MKFLKVFAVMAVVAALAGCSSVQTAQRDVLNGQKLTVADNVKDMEHVSGEIWGLYFFIWPLITGSADNVGDVALLKDTVKVDKVVGIVTAKGKEIGAPNMVDLKSSRGGYGFIFYFNSAQASANAVKPEIK